MIGIDIRSRSRDRNRTVQTKNTFDEWTLYKWII